jgi:hypothetical protein
MCGGNGRGCLPDSTRCRSFWSESEWVVQDPSHFGGSWPKQALLVLLVPVRQALAWLSTIVKRINHHSSDPHNMRLQFLDSMHDSPSGCYQALLKRLVTYTPRVRSQRDSPPAAPKASVTSLDSEDSNRLSMTFKLRIQKGSTGSTSGFASSPISYEYLDHREQKVLMSLWCCTFSIG